eukprot:FR738904.1.p3 GENE.FR738904.1~~FR738904.1.p3  ORF type:complete len:131 (+),score=55.67 FR738904.1:842-1234(+)
MNDQKHEGENCWDKQANGAPTSLACGLARAFLRLLTAPLCAYAGRHGHCAGLFGNNPVAPKKKKKKKGGPREGTAQGPKNPGNPPNFLKAGPPPPRGENPPPFLFSPFLWRGGYNLARPVVGGKKTYGGP